MYVVQASEQYRMLGWSLRVRIVNAAEEVGILALVPLVRESRAPAILRAKAVIQFDIERLLVQGTCPGRDPIMIRIIRRRTDVPIRQGKRLDQFRANGIDQVTWPRRQLAEAERNAGVSRTDVRGQVVERDRTAPGGIILGI